VVIRRGTVFVHTVELIKGVKEMTIRRLFTIVLLVASAWVAYNHYRNSNFNAFMGWAAATTTQLYCIMIEARYKA